jgi:ABC-type amino acid transport substrate-binding protein
MYETGIEVDVAGIGYIAKPGKNALVGTLNAAIAAVVGSADYNALCAKYGMPPLATAAAPAAPPDADIVIMVDGTTDATGALAGFDYEVAKGACDAGSLSCAFIVDFPANAAGAADGSSGGIAFKSSPTHYDAAVGQQITAAKKASMSFTEPYGGPYGGASEGVAIMTRRGDPAAALLNAGLRAFKAGGGYAALCGDAAKGGDCGNTREIDRVTTDGATPQYLGATPDLVFGPDQPRARAAIPPAPRPRPPGASLPRPAVQTIMAGRPFLATASRPAPNSRAVRHSPERFNAAGPWPDPLRTPPQARGRHRAGGRRELRPREHRRRLRRGRRGAQG